MPVRGDEPITAVLRRAIAESGLSFKQLESETGVLRQSLMKFTRGEQGLQSTACDKLAVYFGLELQAKKRGR
jgi:transcriptional regulator with XRE-family HTH domain